jgi:serine/threonine protein kinase/tetratricopeptide (TPR) repeat protein
MPQGSTCPDPSRLEAFQQGTMSPVEEEALVVHLDECPVCREYLDARTASAEFPAGMKPCAGPVDPASEAEPALRRALAVLRALPLPVSGATGRAAPDPDPESGPQIRDRALSMEAGGGPTEPDIASFRDRLTRSEQALLGPSDDPQSLGRFGPYEVLALVGRGGMGVVLKAHDPSLNRIVAVKLLAPALAVDPLARRRFTREARAAAAVCHEHVVSIHSVAETDQSPYLVMQFVAGQSLQEKLDRAGPLGLKEVLRIGMQVAAGLAAAHAQGIVHRDIKPSNILLENSVERVKITDFGLARSIGEATLSDAGTVSGTPGYMSPEQASGGCVDQRSDLFSLGSLLYAMCTGRAPFRGDSPLAVLRQVSDLAPRPIRAQNPEIPEWLAAIVARLMAKDPADRYPSASAVAELLAGRLAELQLPASPPRAEPAGAPQRVPRRSWRRSSWGLALLAGGFLVIATLAWLAIRPARVMPRVDRPAPAKLIAPGPSSSIKAETKVSQAPPSPEPAGARAPDVDPAITELSRAIAAHPEDKNLYHRRGLAFKKANDYSRAIADFDRAIALDPRFFQAYHDRGWAYFDLGDRTMAIVDFGKAIRLQPNDAWLNYCRGLAYNDLGNWEKAIPDLQRAHELNPKHSGALANLGKAYRGTGDLDRSLDYCNRAIAIDPADPWNYVERGLTYRYRKEWEPALQDFHLVQRLVRPEHPKVLAIHAPIYIADTYAAKGDWGPAVLYYDEAIRLDATNPQWRAVRGRAYLQLEKWDSAIADFDRAIALQPGNASFYTPRASAWRRKGQPALAIEDYNESIRLKPNDFGAIYQRGDTYLRLGDGKKALADFEASVKLQPSEAWAHIARGEARRVTGDLAGSMEDCDEAIRLKPGMAFFHLQRGYTYHAREDWRRAVADFDKAIELGRETAEVYNARAAARAKLNDAEGAREDQEHAARLSPAAPSKPNP